MSKPTIALRKEVVDERKVDFLEEVCGVAPEPLGVRDGEGEREVLQGRVEAVLGDEDAAYLGVAQVVVRSGEAGQAVDGQILHGSKAPKDQVGCYWVRCTT